MRMTRRRRIEFSGALYHIFARGNNKQVIFRDEQDYKVYINLLKKYQHRYRFILYAYTLMPNHLHLLIETSVIPLSKIMQGLQQSYTAYFHKKYKTGGHLFQGRYKAILCEKESYLLELVRYIHLNPVRGSLVQIPDYYAWSSHQVYIGKLNQSFVREDIVFKMFSKNEASAKNIYRQFINERLDKRNTDEFYKVIDQSFLGTNEFVKRAEKVVEDKIRSQMEEINHNMQFIKDQSSIKKKSLSSILEIISKAVEISPESILSSSRSSKISDVRALFVFVSSRYAGISNESLAVFLGRSNSSISNMIRKIENKAEKDRSFCSILDKVIKLMKA